MIQEIPMKPGSWTVTLADDTPLSIRDRLDPEATGFSHVVITPNRVDDKAISWAGLLARSRYTGIYRGQKNGRRQLSGPGPVAWLGDEQSTGPIIGRSSIGGPFTLVNESFQNAVGYLSPPSLVVGTVQGPPGAGPYNNTWVDTITRLALDQVCNFFGREYRVNPNLTLDGGDQATLYPTTATPTAIMHRKSGGTDPYITGIPVTQFQDAGDLDDFADEILLHTSSGNGAASAYGTLPYKDGYGNFVRCERVVSGGDVGAGNENTAATAELNRTLGLRRQLTVSTDVYDIGADVKVGDTIHVWDPDSYLVDLTNPVQYRSQLIYPMKVRVYGVTWPVRRGMGVYFRNGVSGLITDLSYWVVPESGDATLAVGASPRLLVA